VVSPCVAFNNHEGSTKSYDYVRQHNEAVSRIDFIDLAEPREAAPAPGEAIDLPQPDGSVMRLRKLHAHHDPTNRLAAMNLVQELAAQGEVATGLIYLEAGASDLHQALDTSATPLNRLGEAALCPGAALLEKVNAGAR
jgi:2-oxoglutarate/2-oxoacid ferredoxin oxidoreductase subunit beta